MTSETAKTWPVGEGTEWFWAIVDRFGLGNVPSDEVAALRLLCDKAERYDALASTARAGAGDWQPTDKVMEISRAKLHDIKRAWADHTALDEGDISFLLRMAGCHLREAPAVPASPRSGAETASPPAPAEHGVEIRAFAHAILHGDDEHRDWLNEASEAFIAGNPLPPARGKGTQSSALSQGGGAGRSERAVEIRDLSDGERRLEVSRGADDRIALVSVGGKLPVGIRMTESEARKVVADLTADLHRSEIAGRSEKREGDALQRLRSAAVKVLSSCNRPHDLDVALDELETVVRATPAAPAQSPSTSDAEG